jgi:hypothetical protein
LVGIVAVRDRDPKRLRPYSKDVVLNSSSTAMNTQTLFKFVGQVLVIPASIVSLATVAMATPEQSFDQNSPPFNATDLAVEPRSTEGYIPIIGGGGDGSLTRPLIPDFSQSPNNSRIILDELELGFGPEGCNRVDQFSVCIY